MTRRDVSTGVSIILIVAFLTVLGVALVAGASGYFARRDLSDPRQCRLERLQRTIEHPDASPIACPTAASRLGRDRILLLDDRPA